MSIWVSGSAPNGKHLPGLRTAVESWKVGLMGTPEQSVAAKMEMFPTVKSRFRREVGEIWVAGKARAPAPRPRRRLMILEVCI